MKKTLFLIAGLLMYLAVTRATASEPACAYEGLSESQCGRVRQITERWHSKQLGSIVLAGVTDPVYPDDVRPNPELDRANAKARKSETEIGPCRYNEGEGRVEVQARAFQLSDEALTQCLSLAFAQARYHAVEGQWLTQLGEHEAWVIDKGVLTKVAVDRKLEATAARMLWASLAARELQNTTPPSADAGRTLASTATAPQASSDANVRTLLGLD